MTDANDLYTLMCACACGETRNPFFGQQFAWYVRQGGPILAVPRSMVHCPILAIESDGQTLPLESGDLSLTVHWRLEEYVVSPRAPGNCTTGREFVHAAPAVQSVDLEFEVAKSIDLTALHAGEWRLVSTRGTFPPRRFQLMEHTIKPPRSIVRSRMLPPAS